MVYLLKNYKMRLNWTDYVIIRTARFKNCSKNYFSQTMYHWIHLRKALYSAADGSILVVFVLFICLIIFHQSFFFLFTVGLFLICCSSQFCVILRCLYFSVSMCFLGFFFGYFFSFFLLSFISFFQMREKERV